MILLCAKINANLKLKLARNQPRIGLEEEEHNCFKELG